MRREAQAWLRAALRCSSGTRYGKAVYAARYGALTRVLDAQVDDGPLKGSDLTTLVDWIAEANQRYAHNEGMIAQWAHRTWLDLANIRPDRIFEGMTE